MLLQGTNFGDFILLIIIAFIAVGFTIGCYAICSISIDLWEMITGNRLEDKFKNCLPWLDDKES